MMIHDDIYSWDGWGGKLKLGSGKCRLRIYDLRKGTSPGVAHLKPIIVVVSDIPDENKPFNHMSVKSCAGHVATNVVKDFHINPNRMLWVEYYEDESNGGRIKYSKEHFDAVEFTWHDNYAIEPVWKALNPAMLDIVNKLIKETSA